MKSKSKEEISSPEPDPVSLVDSLNCDSRNSRYIDLEASRKTATRALSLAKEHLYAKGEAYAYMNLATGHFLRSENKEALEYCSKAMEYFKDHSSEPGYADALTYIGNIYESFGEYETALEYCQTAYKIYEEINYREGLGEVQSVLGLIYTRLSDFELALVAYKQSLQMREELGDQRAVASSLNRIARTYTLKKQYEQALSYYNKSLRIRQSLNQNEAIEWTYLGFASTYEDMGLLDDAQIYYQKILETAESRLDDRLKLQALLGMGRTFSKLKLGTEALKCFEDSLALALKLKAKPLQGEAHNAMADYFETIGSFERALVHYRDYLKIQEEVLNDETRNRLKNQQIAFAVEKSEREREIFQLRNVELKAAYDEIQHANEEVLATNEALQEQKKELQLALENLKITQSKLIDSEKMASVAVLTAGIAHELNNPINFVSGNVNPLRRDIKDLFSLLKKYDDIVLNKDLGKEFGEVADLKDKMDYSFVTKEITKCGVERIMYCDTSGFAVPTLVELLISRIRMQLPQITFGFHFHDTFGTAIANCVKALECDSYIFESSVGGLGGCPFAEGASGNVATEDLVWVMEKMGAKTGIQLDLLLEASHFIKDRILFNRSIDSRLFYAKTPKDFKEA